MATASSKDLPAGQWVYNYHLYAYNPRLTDREQIKAIRINSLKKCATRTERKAKLETAHAEDNSERPTLEPSAEEDVREMSDENLDTAIIVGVHLSDPSPSTPAQQSASINSLKSLQERAYDPTALRAVCPRFRTTATYYALIHQDPVSKLCDGVMVEGSEVFFYPEFRDDNLTAYAERKAKWGENVRNSMEKTEGKKRKEREVKDIDKSMIDENTSLGAENASIT
jgi:hypothetical protein